MKPSLTIARWPVVAALTCLAVTTATAGSAAGAAGTRQASSMPPACAPPSSPTPPPVQPTTVTTIEQAYYCVFANYYSGSVLDDRVLLAGAFAGLTQELDILGHDQSDATMPALTGNRNSDWDAFAAVYQHVISQLPNEPALRQNVAGATMTDMIASLGDNHARWSYPPVPPPGAQPGDADGLGIATSPAEPLAAADPQEALPPLYISQVQGGPAAEAGLRPGDVIKAVDGAPPFTNGAVSPGVFQLLGEAYPQEQPVRITLWRPATSRTWTVTLKPALFKPTAAATAVVTSELLNGDTAYVRLAQFRHRAADDVLTAIAALRKGRPLRGVILDLRGNGGGDPSEAARLLGAFEHGTPWSYACTVSGNCTPNSPDATVPLLHLPLVVLTDRNSASASDGFSGAVKDLHLGILVGTRTAGFASGPGAGFLLDDGSVLGLPTTHWLGADHELINGIGVAPDYYIPMTAQDLSTGHDPGIAKALTLLGS